MAPQTLEGFQKAENCHAAVQQLQALAATAKEVATNVDAEEGLLREALRLASLAEKELDRKRDYLMNLQESEERRLAHEDVATVTKALQDTTVLVTNLQKRVNAGQAKARTLTDSVAETKRLRLDTQKHFAPKHKQPAAARSYPAYRWTPPASNH